MYQKHLLPFDQIPQLSQRDKAYQKPDPALRPFYQHEVSIDAIADAIAAKEKQQMDRSRLVETLLQQYADLPNNDAAVANIKLLKKDNAYTIITAHQPSLLTGPLYYIYKICSVISLCRSLTERYPDQHFVPVFVTGGEDHDFDEIASATFFNKTYTWQTDQVGATGRMTLDGLDTVLAEVKETFGTMPYAEELSGIIDAAYAQSSTYGDFAVRLTHALFARHGLVIVNMDHRAYKELLLPHVIRDIQERISHRTVQEDQEALIAAGYKAQAHAREVNIFYHDGDRHRVIAQEDGSYSIADKSYSQDELIALLTAHPENISPNVVLRPLYQELILPNLAYVGGGGELAYWLERGRMFEAFSLPMPMLIRRDSLLLIDGRSHKTMIGANISIEKIFDREEQIDLALAQSLSAVDIDLSKAKELLRQAYAEITAISDQIDPTKSKSILADHARVEKGIDNIESKLIKAEKQKNETAINKIKRIKQKLFPGNDSLQERKENFIPYYLKHGPAWIDAIIDSVNPMEKEFKVLVEES